jgi:hypothetical protein
MHANKPEPMKNLYLYIPAHPHFSNPIFVQKYNF